jgi:hypothetical protein
VDVGLALYQTILLIYNPQDLLPHFEYDNSTFKQLPWSVVQQIAPPPLHNLAQLDPQLWHCWKFGDNSLLVVKAGEADFVHRSLTRAG